MARSRDKLKFRARFRKRNRDIEFSFLLPIYTKTGMARDGRGALIPPLFYKSMKILLGEKTLITAQLSRWISSQPIFRFHLNSIRSGDIVTVIVVDNNNKQEVFETKVDF